MKYNKKILILPLISTITLVPLSIISCSNNPKINNIEYINDLLNLINKGQIKIKLKLKNNNQTDIKINFFENQTNKDDPNHNVEKIFLELDESKITSNNIDEKNKRIEEIKNKIKLTSVEYSHYFFPILNNDENSSIVFKLKINNNEKEFNINFQDLVNDNNLKIRKLTELELKKEIEDKILSIRNIYPNLSYEISQFLFKNLDEQTDENKILISDVLKSNINRFILNNCKYFADWANNYFSLINNINFDKNSINGKYDLIINLWTSEINSSNTKNVSMIKIPFNYNVVQIVNDFINGIKMKIKDNKINDKKNTFITDIKNVNDWFVDVPTSNNQVHVSLISNKANPNDSTVLDVVYEISCGQFKKTYTKSEPGFKVAI